jgi:hypothetical protein
MTVTRVSRDGYRAGVGCGAVPRDRWRLFGPFAGSDDRGDHRLGLLGVRSFGRRLVSAVGGWERFEFLERGGEFGGPGPVVLEA